MDEGIQWIIIAAFWLISAAVRKARKKQGGADTPDTSPLPQPRGIDPRPEQQHVLALADHVLATQQWLRTLPVTAQWALPLFDNLVKPEVDRLIWQAEMVVQTPTNAAIIALQVQRQRVAMLAHAITEEAHDWARGAQPELWVGQTLLDALPALNSELPTVVGATPDVHVLEEVNLSREELQHVYAAWVSQIFSDVFTAVITPRRARLALQAIEQMGGIHQSHDNVPPLAVRGHVLADILQVPFRPLSAGKDLVIRLSSGEYALPSNIVIRDVVRLGQILASRPLSGLNNYSPQDLATQNIQDTSNNKSAPQRPNTEYKEQVSTPQASSQQFSPAVDAFSITKDGRRKTGRAKFKRLVRDAIIIDEVYGI